MKFNIITAGILLITLSSCKDFLDVVPETTVTTANYFQSQEDFEQAVGGIYAPLQDIYERDWIVTELRSDNTYFTFDVANRGPKPEEDVATFMIESNNRNIEDQWSENYLIISRANQVLDMIEDVDFDQAAKDNLKGQAYFLRAFAYFDLVKNFGGVPLFLEPAASYEGTFMPRSPVNEVYDQIISDASAAAGLLPTKADQEPGRVTSGAAHTLLGDVYITLERWDDAETALKSVTNMSYSLLPDYADIFRPSNEGNDEIIFEVEYMEGTSQSLHSSFPYWFLPELSDPSVITGVSPASANGNGSFNVPTPDLIEAYEDTINDERFTASIAFYTGPSPLVGVTYDHTPYINKYQHPHGVYNQTGQNWPVYRYAEVLLMLAESLNEQGKSSEALSYLNQVRNRAGLNGVAATSQSELSDIILHERRIELAFENKRWHDLVRKGLAVNVMNAFGAKVKANPQDYYYAPGNTPPPNAFEVTENKLVYPIPLTEIRVNPDLEQNTGY